MTRIASANIIPASGDVDNIIPLSYFRRKVCPLPHVASMS